MASPDDNGPKDPHSQLADDAKDTAEAYGNAADGAAGMGQDLDAATGGTGGTTAGQVTSTVARAGQVASNLERMVEAMQSGDSGDAVSGALGGAGGIASNAAQGIEALAGSSRAAHAVAGAFRIAQDAAFMAQGIARGVHDIAERVAAAGAAHGVLERVAYSFHSKGDPGGEWRVVRVTYTEALGELYRCVVDLANDDPGVDTQRLLGKDATFEMTRDGHPPHPVHGVVARVENQGTTAGKRLCRVTIVPALYALGQRYDSYIFQDLTTPEIVSVVLGEGLSPWSRESDMQLQADYPTREYCVQYNESDLDFVLRLLQEEGISFHFDQSGEVEKIVLVDTNDAYPAVQTMDGGAIEIQGDEAGTHSAETIRHFELDHTLESTTSVIRDFDWTRPALDLTRVSKAQDANHREREVYAYPGPLTIGTFDDGANNYTKDDGKHRSLITRERFKLQEVTGRGHGVVMGMTAGSRFDLTGHLDASLEQNYLITRIEHTGEAPEQLTNDTDATRHHVERYANRFETIPHDVPFVPARTLRRPSVLGTQTAWVVGPDGEEIYTDKHGRIKVKFHWDREAPRDEHSSCWVRVAQTWAGPGWGFVFLPRIGMEVVVDFLEGNPDRPLVIGCVYNGLNRPPYALPDKKTVSTIKSNSSTGGNGSNEIRFEDLAGSEEVYVHAQKDFNEVVEHNHSTVVHANQSNSVDGDQSETVHGKQTMDVDKNRIVHIKGSQSVTIDGSKPEAGVSGSKLGITGDYKVDASNTIEMQAPTHIKFTCGGSSILIEPGKITMTAGGGAQVVLDANALMHSAAGSKVMLDGNGFVQSSGGASVLFDGNALMKSSAGSAVLLDADAKMGSTGGSLVKLDANALMSGATNATVSGSAAATVGAPTATLAGGGGSVQAAGAGVTATGGQVNLSGGMVNIAGGMVKIN